MDVVRTDVVNGSKNYANMISHITGIDLIDCFLGNKVDDVAKAFDTPAKAGMNKEANYYHQSGVPFSNKMVAKVVENYGEVHNIEDIASFIHSVDVIGGTEEDYIDALASVRKFKKDRGIGEVQQPEVVELVEENEEEKVKTR